MGIKAKMKMKLLTKSLGKIKEHIPSLEAFAIENDQGYNALMKVIMRINEKRRAKRKFVVSSI